MKSVVMAAVAAAGMAIGGCETPDQDRIDPHRNYPDVKAGNIEPTGTLSVRGVSDMAGNTNGLWRHDPGPVPLYTVYDGNGNFVADSRSGTTDLAPGRYLVRLNESANDEANSTFWVTIESGKTTIVDADRVHEANRANAQ